MGESPSELACPWEPAVVAVGLERALVDLERTVDGGENVPVGGCTYCYSETDLALVAGPAEEVPLGLLSSIAFEVPDHWDDFPGIYRKFTPAILRALVHDRLHIDEELVAYRLAAAGCWTTWPEPEQRAVLGVLHALLEETLSVYPRRPSLDETLRALSTTPEPFERWLALVDAAPHGAADHHVADLCRAWMPELAEGTLVFGWLDDWVVPEVTRDWLRDQCRKRLAPMRDDLPADVRSLVDLLL